MSKTHIVVTVCLSIPQDVIFYIDPDDKYAGHNLASFSALVNKAVNSVVTRDPPNLSKEKWREEVAKDLTELGYEDWVRALL